MSHIEYATSTILKYPLVIADEQKIEMPQHAFLRTIQRQGDKLFLWAQVYPGNVPELRSIRCFGTGQLIPGDGLGMTYLATVQYAGVWHFFDNHGVRSLAG